MKISQYLIIHKVGTYKANITVRKSKARLGSNEVGILLNLNIPDELFDRPMFQASATIVDTEKVNPKVEIKKL